MPKFSKILTSFLLLVFLAPAFLTLAQLTPEQERALLEKELKELEEQIAKYEQDISKTEKEKNTLKNKIYILRRKINKLDLQIQQSNTMIKDISLQVKDTEEAINETSLKIEKLKRDLAEILENIYRQDQESFFEILVASPQLSDFFNNLSALEQLNLKRKELLEDIKKLKISLENQKESLDSEKEDLERVVKIMARQKQESAALKKERERTLQMTEAQYQQYLREKQKAEKKAAEIRARIFELIGVSKAPTFGEALEMAKYVSSITGIRPAFLLAVLTQESNIGKNVGQCYLKDPKTGSGVVIKTGQTVSRVMSPRRDVSPFLTITKELGRDPYATPVSCPMSFGWGGAMGPAQFIPSTWMLYRDRLREVSGRAADPWNIRDAFLAAALYLTDYGAAKQTRTAEWRAAMIYFSGSTNSKYRFYGDSVLSIADRYQADIEAIEKGGQ
ncbi:MAG TPA: hypothetical protein ENL33_00910 [Candidatus Parcubacteria bacterium]|nr:hypothetical protein [Candidatus Parcubacteria bacterium]